MVSDVAATPLQAAGLGAKIKVLVAYGSESGNAKRGIERWVKKWQAREGLHFEVVDVLTGNALAEKIKTGDGHAQASRLEIIAQKYDVLLVATSSYGDGDPPSNMRELTAILDHEASMKSDALTGLQHAVLGFGSTTYTTFQNVPRLTDKFLGECGSRRMVQRAEIDENDPEGEELQYNRWGEEVFQVLQALPPARETPAACPWTQPAEKIAVLSSGEDKEYHPLGIPTIYALGLVGAAALVFARSHFLV